MDLSLDESQEILVNTFSELLERECPPTVVRDCEEHGGFSAELWERYCELGANVMGLPEQAEGLGMSLLELGLVATESGRVLAPVPFVEVASAGRLLAALDPNDPLLAKIASGSPRLSLALPRPHATKTTDPHTCRLVPFGSLAEAVIAWEDGRLVVASDAKSRRSARLRNLGSGAIASWNLAALDEGDCRVLAEGEAADRSIERAASEWKLLTAFYLVGLAKRALEIGADYARERIQFGVAIGGFQAIAHPLAECAIRVDGAELLAWEAAWADEAEPARFDGLASMAFAWAAQTALRTADISLHTHGGYGFSTEYDIQLYYRRACAIPGLAGGAREALQDVTEQIYERPARPS